MKVAVTGGAGFIGSHLADALVAEGHGVTVIDDLSGGRKANLNPKARFVKRDVRKDLSDEFAGLDAVFHFAADADVRASANTPRKTFDINVGGTFSVLESCRKAGVGRIVFPSTSTVYGEAGKIPTPEDYPCAPISNYGASKLSCEAYLSAYSASYGMKCTSLRYANIIGERSTHGVICDFFMKLKKNPKALEILGDGNQDKSYLHVSDCISATLTAWKKQKAAYDVFNIGSREKTKVSEIAALVCREMKLKPVLRYTGTPRGWAGDMKVMLLDISKMQSLGWAPKVGFRDGARSCLSWLRNGF
ncbi:MAG TPA: NAD-dependent epimerase/dehydratase family protein [Candidatus Bilamarchaeum sp.]|nr:NAD-dependent epimerase/dehydratase family protein [Candidatus Bilamarchaeum sp.]